MKIQFIFKWYDMWVGFFWDAKKKWLYFFPIPMFGIIFKKSEKKLWDSDDPNKPWNFRK